MKLYRQFCRQVFCDAYKTQQQGCFLAGCSPDIAGVEAKYLITALPADPRLAYADLLPSGALTAFLQRSLP